MWVECCPNYLHITEFEEELNDQLSYIYHSWKDVVTQRTYDRIHDFYKEINKSHFDELTIEEKVRLFQIIQPERY